MNIPDRRSPSHIPPDAADAARPVGLIPCRCGGTGRIAEAHYPTWGQVECDSCDRIEFGCDEETAVGKWNRP